MSPPDVASGTLDVTVEVRGEDPVRTVADAASSEQWVYFNSVDAEVEVVDVQNHGDSLVLVLRGPGSLESEGEATFNGQRLVIGQWVEIRGSYFAQGTVMDIEPAAL